MKKKTALITGVSGQDGAYLAQLLLRRLGIENKIIHEEMEMAEIYEIERLFKKYKFDEVYNLAAQSFVQTSFSSPLNTSNITGLGVLRILEAIRNYNPKARFYQASSSEMFGEVFGKKQNENTEFRPQSPYAVSKVFGHLITKNYRKSYGLYSVSGILFNHESPLRGEEFVTRKITLGLIKILNGDLQLLELGNINAKRDWGYAKEYVEVMWKMLQQKKPEDFVVSTGQTYSIKQFINETVKYLNLKTKWIGKGINEKLVNLENNKIIIKINSSLFRPAEVNFLKGDSKRAKKKLNLRPKTNLIKLIRIMVDEELKYYQKSRKIL